MVRVNTENMEYALKGIDFDCSCFEGTPITGEGTREYRSPEVAKWLLNRTTVPHPASSHKMDVFAFGLIAFAICNDNTSFWQVKGIHDNHDNRQEILHALAVLTDSDVGDVLNRVFEGETKAPLRKLLAKALKIDPNERATADVLLDSSYFHSLQGSDTMESLAEIKHTGQRILATMEKNQSETMNQFVEIKNNQRDMLIKLEGIEFGQVSLETAIQVSVAKGDHPSLYDSNM